MTRTIYNTDFAEYLPEPLKHDEKMLAFAKALTGRMLEVSGLTDRVLIYARLDKLPEEMLDVLAYDLHCDWYDTGYPLEIKRKILKSNIAIHKRLGTKYSVKKALADVYGTADVQEWFEYGGEPYCFKVTVDVGSFGLTEDTSRDLERKMHFYKNARSHCDGIYYTVNAKKAAAYTAPALFCAGRLKVKAQTGQNVEKEER